MVVYRDPKAARLPKREPPGWYGVLSALPPRNGRPATRDPLLCQSVGRVGLSPLSAWPKLDSRDCDCARNLEASGERTMSRAVPAPKGRDTPRRRADAGADAGTDAGTDAGAGGADDTYIRRTCRQIPVAPQERGRLTSSSTRSVGKRKSGLGKLGCGGRVGAGVGPVLDPGVCGVPCFQCAIVAAA